jgi:hypothetical protein
MNKIALFLISLALLALGACSSMEPSSDVERYEGLLPSDYTVSGYLAVNPDAAAIQATSAIFGHNADWKAAQTAAGVSADDLASKIAADSTAFFADVTALQAFQVSYLNQKWVSVDSLEPVDRAALQRFNLMDQAGGELAFVQNYLATSLDSSLVTQTYILYGKAEGRAYRACADTDPKTEKKSIRLPNVMIVGTTVDYTDYSFCLYNDGVTQTFYVVPQ